MNMKFMLLLLLSSMMIMMINSWLNMWIFLEINLISFIFIMINYKNYLSLESSLLYFLIQTLASIILLFSMIYMIMWNNFNMLLYFSLLLKMGMSPLHFWLIMIIESMNWMIVYLLLTWQKIAPMMILNQLLNTKMILYFIIFSLMMGALMGLNYSSLKKILVFSSINQLSWMITSLIFINKIFKLYFMFYMYLMMIILYSLNKYNLNFLNKFLKMNNNNYINLIYYSNFLSMGGLPPFIGFLPKLLIINLLNNFIIIFLFIMFSMMPLFFYIRIMISTMLINSWKLNMINKINNNKLLMFMSIINNMFMIMLMLMY